LGDQPGFASISQLVIHDRLTIARNCGGVPLAIRWVVLSTSKSAVQALALAESLTGLNRNAEELLEFCFRRIFDAMPGAEKSILHVLSLFQRPAARRASATHLRLALGSSARCIIASTSSRLASAQFCSVLPWSARQIALGPFVELEIGFIAAQPIATCQHPSDLATRVDVNMKVHVGTDRCAPLER